MIGDPSWKWTKKDKKKIKRDWKKWERKDKIKRLKLEVKKMYRGEKRFK